MNLKKLSALAATAAVVSGVLAGCGASTSTPSTGGQPAAQQPAAKTPVELTVWTHFGDDPAAAIDKIAQEWAQKTGNKVTVQVDNSDFGAFPTTAASGKGPDIMFGIPHDNLGASYKAGLLGEVPANILDKSAFAPGTLDAVSYDGKVYGLPVSEEAIALYYRKDKVPTPPTTWADFEAQAKKSGFMFDLKNFYFAFGFMQGEGGYVFKSNNGALDVNDIGLANDGAVKGTQLLSDFVTKYSFMKPDVTGDIAKGKFTDGSIAFYLSGPWDVGDFNKANVPYGVVKFPTLPDGKKFMPFSGIQASFVPTTSKHQAEAWELDKYLVEHAALPLFKSEKRIPVLKSVLEDPAVKGDAVVAGFVASAADATPMPNIAAMGQVWGPAADALTLVVTGKADAKTAMTDAVKKIKDGITANK